MQSSSVGAFTAFSFFFSDAGDLVPRKVDFLKRRRHFEELVRTDGARKEKKSRREAATEPNRLLFYL